MSCTHVFMSYVKHFKTVCVIDSAAPRFRKKKSQSEEEEPPPLLTLTEVGSL